MVPFAIEQGFLTAFSFITFCLVCIPLYWHLEGEHPCALVVYLVAYALHSMECGMRVVHILGGAVHSHAVYQLQHLENQRYQLRACLG